MTQMQFVWDGVQEALRMIVALDSQVVAAAWRSIWISSVAVFAATVLALPAGLFVARVSFVGRRLLILCFRAGMAVPTVFLGIVCYGLFSRRGPLGPFDLLYTPWAIVVGEFLLAFPIVLSISHGALRSLDPRAAETAYALGANLPRRCATLLSEARVGVTLAVLTALARCITELGIAMMVGGNIKGRTRTLATATALETGNGEFAAGLAMGIILLFIALCVTAIIGRLASLHEE